MFFKSIYSDIDKNAYKVFMTLLSIIIASLLLAIAFGTAARNNKMVKSIFLEQSRVLFRQISMTRIWAAQYGGVYVIKKEGVESNPFLKDADITSIDGRVLTLKNPALMTKELSVMSMMNSSFSFRITSLKTLNPENDPDSFEKAALLAFENGETEAWFTDIKTLPETFRYIAAIKTRESCLACHAEQGYKIGDVRGAISIKLNVSSQLADLKKTTILIFVLAIITSALCLFLVYTIVRRLRKKLHRANKDLALAAITDGLTGLLNRTEAINRLHLELEKAMRPKGKLSAAILDADNFKFINDNYGHAIGDSAIKIIAKAMKEEARVYDIAARYGGEEFLMVFPGSSGTGAFSACERIRNRILELGKDLFDQKTILTLSIGVAEYPFSINNSSDKTIEDNAISINIPYSKENTLKADQIANILLLQADKAMYEAKKAGKNRSLVYDSKTMPLS